MSDNQKSLAMHTMQMKKMRIFYINANSVRQFRSSPALGRIESNRVGSVTGRRTWAMGLMKRLKTKFTNSKLTCTAFCIHEHSL